jgi:hypothetical protein
MFQRLASRRLTDLARGFPAVVVLGPRQAGKTTLVRLAFPDLPYLDCEDPRTAEFLLEDPAFALQQRERAGLIIDEAQAVPAVFSALRGLIDAERGRNGRFVILGSAQPTLVRGVAESLAGRAAVVELDPLAACEARTGGSPVGWKNLWLKGGFPDAARGDFRTWWDAYLRLFLERDLPQFGVAADPRLMRRLMTMVAHAQGGLFNASQFSSALGVSYHTVQRYIDVLERTFLVRRLRPYFRNVGKRLVKASRLYLRDTGLVHHLLNISTLEQLEEHPIRGASWETFVIEDVLRREAVAHPDSQAYFWRTAAGAEIDLVIERAHRRVAVEIKTARGGSARSLRSLREALPDLDAYRAWIVDQAPGIERLADNIARGGFEELLEGVPA